MDTQLTGPGDDHRYPTEITLMQFNILSLILLSTLAACHMAIHQNHAVLSLSCISFCVTAYSLANAVRLQRQSAVQLVTTGAISAFVSMLAFGLLTIGTYWVHMAATDSWPDPQDLYIGYGYFLVLFIAIYGGGAALAGTMLGLLVYVVVRSNTRFNTLSIHHGG